MVIRVARIFNTYGPRMNPNDGRVVSNFIMQALQNRDITIYGDGQQTRSFCYVDDLVDGLYKLMHCNFDGKPPLPVNLGNPHEFTILDLAEKVISITGSSSKLVSMPLPQDDPRQRRPDISRAKSILDGWEPKVSLDEGLEKTILHFETLIKKFTKCLMKKIILLTGGTGSFGHAFVPMTLKNSIPRKLSFFREMR